MLERWTMGTLELGSRGLEGEIAHSLCLKKRHEDIDIDMRHSSSRNEGVFLCQLHTHAAAGEGFLEAAGKLQAPHIHSLEPKRGHFWSVRTSAEQPCSLGPTGCSVHPGEESTRLGAVLSLDWFSLTLLESKLRERGCAISLSGDYRRPGKTEWEKEQTLTARTLGPLLVTRQSHVKRRAWCCKKFKINS